MGFSSEERGEDLLALLDGIDGWGVVAEYFDDVELPGEADRAGTERDGGVLARLRPWFG